MSHYVTLSAGWRQREREREIRCASKNKCTWCFVSLGTCPAGGGPLSPVHAPVRATSSPHCASWPLPSIGVLASCRAARLPVWPPARWPAHLHGPPRACHGLPGPAWACGPACPATHPPAHLPTVPTPSNWCLDLVLADCWRSLRGRLLPNLRRAAAAAWQEASMEHVAITLECGCVHRGPQKMHHRSGALMSSRQLCQGIYFEQRVPLHTEAPRNERSIC